MRLSQRITNEERIERQPAAVLDVEALLRCPHVAIQDPVSGLHAGLVIGDADRFFVETERAFSSESVEVGAEDPFNAFVDESREALAFFRRCGSAAAH